MVLNWNFGTKPQDSNKSIHEPRIVRSISPKSEASRSGICDSILKAFNRDDSCQNKNPNNPAELYKKAQSKVLNENMVVREPSKPERKLNKPNLSLVNNITIEKTCIASPSKESVQSISKSPTHNMQKNR